MYFMGLRRTANLAGEFAQQTIIETQHDQTLE